MQIKEVRLAHFGKFTDRSIRFEEGINLIYGENESGKSTIHTAIKALIFGMERKRGRAAANDTFSQYEPWENPNYYAGTIRFVCGERTFCLNRQFDKYAKSEELFCEDDGEELSLEQGDLEMLLGGLTEPAYDNTVSIGQLCAEADGMLAVQLRNYAANYYAAGNSELNLEAAAAQLRERKKELEREEKEAERSRRLKREKIQLEASYVMRDMQRMDSEREQLKAEQEQCRKEQKELERQREKRQSEDAGLSGRFDGWRIHPAESLAMLGALLLIFIGISRPWNFLVAVVIALAEGMYVWNRMKDGRRKKKPDEEGMQAETSEALQQLGWKAEKLNEDYREKKTQYENLKEQAEEILDPDGESGEREFQKKAVELALTQLQKLSAEMQTNMSRKLNDRVSAILSGITAGKYERVWVDEKLHISLISGGRKLAIEQVSRGTLEQVYFALRMASAEVLYEEELPVILDDTFAYYDDVRLEETLRWLERNRKQVLIFTCQKREEEILRQNGMKICKIRI